MRPGTLAAVVFGLAGLAASGAHAGELLVVSDSAAFGYARGSVLADGASVAIPAGERLALIDANGRGLTLRGPYDGALHSPPSEAPQSAAVLAALKAILDPSAHVSVGAARKAGEAPAPPDPRYVDVSDDATVCVAGDGSAQLWRPTPTRHTVLFVTRLATGERAEVDWPADQPTVPWPARLPVVNGETYQFALQGALTRPRITLKLLRPGETSVAAAKRLADAGCRGQAVAMLQQIAAADVR